MRTLGALVIATAERVRAQSMARGAQGEPGPAGPTGAPGKDGPPGLVWRGEWSPGIEYQPSDAVSHQGSSYVAVSPAMGVHPSRAVSGWDMLAKRGTDGKAGRDNGTIVVQSAIPGAAGSSGYTHTQGAAAGTWVINHNLGFRPIVQLFDVGGAEFEADVLHISANQANVYMVVPVAGTARCS